MRILPTIVTTAMIAGLASNASAVNFDLHAVDASKIVGNTTSSFYEVSGAGAESGTSAGDFSSTLGGNENTGFWVKISFGSNPQPDLTSAFLKASNKYLLWDSVDLTAFNAGTFDSITLWNDGGSAGIRNQNNKYQGTSHAGILGEPGTTEVPDGGSTLILVGAAFAVMSAVKRKLEN